MICQWMEAFIHGVELIKHLQEAAVRSIQIVQGLLQTFPSAKHSIQFMAITSANELAMSLGLATAHWPNEVAIFWCSQRFFPLWWSELIIFSWGVSGSILGWIFGGFPVRRLISYLVISAILQGDAPTVMFANLHAILLPYMAIYRYTCHKPSEIWVINQLRQQTSHLNPNS